LEHGHFCHQNGLSTGKTSWAQFCFVTLSFGDITNLEKKKKKFSQIYTKNNPPILNAKKQQNLFQL
jgi:hypothetical protein